jgi:8-oxo-dGTP pyrophosphatase MutT (NUDIX family)
MIPTTTFFRYVLGFYFTLDQRRVALIRKNKPEWQAGRLNGIGGKIEEGERPIDAMVREFAEEAGYATSPESWRNFAEMSFPGCSVECFAATGDPQHVKTMTDEMVIWKPVDGILADRNSTVHTAMKVLENIPLLVLLAEESLAGAGAKILKTKIVYRWP